MRPTLTIVIVLLSVAAALVSLARFEREPPACDGSCQLRRREVLIITEPARVAAIRAELGLEEP